MVQDSETKIVGPIVKGRPKDQGTRLETATVKYFLESGLEARRLAEGGRNDLGDIELHGLRQPFPYMIIECKARANLNVHQTLAKAIEKARGAPVAVLWKKLTRKGDNQRRTMDGVGSIVAMSEETFCLLIGGKPVEDWTGS